MYPRYSKELLRVSQPSKSKGKPLVFWERRGSSSLQIPEEFSTSFWPSMYLGPQNVMGTAAGSTHWTYDEKCGTMRSAKCAKLCCMTLRRHQIDYICKFDA